MKGEKATTSLSVVIRTEKLYDILLFKEEIRLQRHWIDWNWSRHLAFGEMGVGYVSYKRRTYFKDLVFFKRKKNAYNVCLSLITFLVLLGDLLSTVFARWGLHGSDLFRHVPLMLDRIGIWGIWRPGWHLEFFVTLLRPLHCHKMINVIHSICQCYGWLVSLFGGESFRQFWFCGEGIWWGCACLICILLACRLKPSWTRRRLWSIN